MRSKITNAITLPKKSVVKLVRGSMKFFRSSKFLVSVGMSSGVVGGVKTGKIIATQNYSPAELAIAIGGLVLCVGLGLGLED